LQIDFDVGILSACVSTLIFGMEIGFQSLFNLLADSWELPGILFLCLVALAIISKRDFVARDDKFAMMKLIN